MATENRYGELGSYAERLIKRKAAEIVKLEGFTPSGLEDIEQDLAFEILRRRPDFDPQRSSYETFVTRVVNHAMTDMVDKRWAPKRNPRRCECSLNELIPDGEGGLVERAETLDLRAKAKDVESKAKAAYAEAVAPYRDACRKAGVECEFAGGRATNVTAAVRFLIEKVKGGIKVAIKGKPETEELLTDKALGESVNRAAFGYTDKHIGPKEKIGNKGGGLAVRLRAILAKK